jgi:hypothetical protein
MARAEALLATLPVYVATVKRRFDSGCFIQTGISAGQHAEPETHLRKTVFESRLVPISRLIPSKTAPCGLGQANL